MHFRHFKFVGLFLMGILPLLTSAQISDSTFKLKSFTYDDVVDRDPIPEKQVMAANRVEENADELPVRTIIINRDELREGGYTTLVDVLKNIPGFRTSQPGSAALGETFTMRGLQGNNYTQIRINGLPILPSGAPGMPIGANLPITQAERIEIVIGPASTLYGADALGGVINIVLPEVKWPVEAMANVGLSSANRNEMHLSLGGKIGKGKNTARYALYGSSMRSLGLNLNTDDDLFRVDDDVVANSLYVGNGNTPRISNLPQEGRMIGLQLNYRDFTVSFLTADRSDHSAIGSHPSEIGYHDPSTLTGEVITQSFIQYEKELGAKWWLQSNLSYVNYNVDENSSYWGVQHPISNDRNFIYAGSGDFFLEQLVQYREKKWSILGGATYQRQQGKAYFPHFSRPVNTTALFNSNANLPEPVSNEFSILDSIPSRLNYDINIFGIFGQFYYQGKKIKVIAGGRYDINDQSAEFSPKVGFFYQLNEKTRLRAFAARGFKIPNTYNRFYNFLPVPPEMPMGGPGGPPPPPPPPDEDLTFVQNQTELKPEIFTSIEGGIDHMVNENWSISGHVFYHILENSIYPVLRFPELDFTTPGMGMQMPAPSNASIGFANGDTESRLLGTQASLTYQSDGFTGSLSIQLNNGSESLDTIAELDTYRSVPDYQANANLSYRFKKDLKIALFGSLFGATTGVVLEENDEVVVSSSTDYYNIDFQISKRISNHFSVLFKVTNLSNTATRGIFSAPFSGHDFDFVPQLNRMFHLRLNYTLN